ncbi:MAG: hypothetical protein WC323_03365 [Patescibacteria group bacterium]|jgi:hypothetical protein
MAENNPTTEKINPRIESMPAERGVAGRSTENIDFKNLDKKAEAERKAKEKAEQAIKAAPDGGYASSKSITVKEVEEILSGGLEDIFAQMPPAVQQEFKSGGEATAKKIHALLQQPKIKIKKIAKLIMDWLKIIPGVNKFFLEQESKIKTDSILRLR